MRFPLKKFADLGFFNFKKTSEQMEPFNGCIKKGVVFLKKNLVVFCKRFARKCVPTYVLSILHFVTKVTFVAPQYMGATAWIHIVSKTGPYLF